MFQEPILPPRTISNPFKRRAPDEPVNDISKRQAIGSLSEVPPFGPVTSLLPRIVPRPTSLYVPVQPKYLPPSPSSIASVPPRTPVTAGRKRGRPPKSSQASRQVSTLPDIVLGPATLSLPAPYQTVQQPPSVQELPDSREKAWSGLIPQPAQELPTAEPVDMPADFKAEGGQSSNALQTAPSKDHE